MNKSHLILLATFGSFALLAGAFMFQMLGYAPCQMCLWQRWPHAVAVVIGLLALVLARFQAAFALLGALAAATTAGLGVYHSGVERDLWDGPTSCSGGGGLNIADPLNTDIAPIVMCDDIVWTFLGQSMATYNALFSLALVGVWLVAARLRA